MAASILRSRGFRSLLTLGDVGLAIVLAAGALGFVLRDRVTALAILTYVPLSLVGAFGAVWFLFRPGRRRGAVVAAGLALVAHLSLSGEDRGRPARPGETTLRVVQQNVCYGGALVRNRDSWRAQLAALAEARPDVLVISEVVHPDIRGDVAAELERATGQKWWLSNADGMKDAGYVYRLVVATPWPHLSRQLHQLHDGVALEVEIDHPTGPLRVWAVDGLSTPSRNRRAMIASLEEALSAAADRGAFPEILAGDFNIPGRSVAFEPLHAHHVLASALGAGRRGTAPRPLPVLDLDHVWVVPDLDVLSAQTLVTPYSDHLGVLVTLALNSSGDPESFVSERRRGAAPSPFGNKRVRLGE